MLSFCAPDFHVQRSRGRIDCIDEIIVTVTVIVDDGMSLTRKYSYAMNRFQMTSG